MEFKVGDHVRITNLDTTDTISGKSRLIGQTGVLVGLRPFVEILMDDKSLRAGPGVNYCRGEWRIRESEIELITDSKISEPIDADELSLGYTEE